jgi:predicted RND superfamily exporter protein
MASVKPTKVTVGSTSLLQTLSDKVNAALSTSFGDLGHALGLYPARFMLLTFVIVIACGMGFSDFTTENRAEKLWIPQGTTAQADSLKFTSNYNNPFRINYVIALASGSSNFLTKTNLLELMDLHDEVEAAEVTAPDPVTGEKDATWDLNNLCFLVPGNGHPCLIDSILELWSYDRATLLLETDISLQQTLAAADQERLESYMSDYSVTSGIAEASGAKLTYFIENRQVLVGGDYEDLPADEWENDFLDIAKKCSPSLSCYRSAGRSLSDEFGNAIGGDIILMNIGFLVIIIYLSVNLGRCGDAVGQRFALSMISVLAIGMAIAASMGFSQLCGWSYTPVHSVLPFVLLGLGVDDSFVIMTSFLQTDRTKELPDRMRYAMSHAGVSITVTSMTDFVAFLISTSTSLPALASFCFYAATGIFFLFLFQCIFFSAYVVIDARRQEARRIDCCCCFTAKVDDEKDQLRIKKDSEPGMVSDFMRHKFGPFVVSKTAAPIIMFFAVAAAAVGLWGASELTVESNSLDFIPDGSYIKDTYAKNDALFGGDGTPVSVVMEDIDYFAKQQAIYDIKARLDGKAFLLPTTGPDFVSWYHSYVEYVNADCYGECIGVKLAGDDNLPSDETEFYDNLNKFLVSSGSQYANSVIFDQTDANTIVSAKIDMKFDPKINDIAKLQVKAMKEMRDEVSNMDLSAYPYTYEFLVWETFIIIRDEMINNVSLCMLAVFIITLILIAHPTTASLVFVAVLFAIIEILGVMYFWGLVIDNVSVINLTLAVGLAVDYSAHVAHCFMLKGGTDKRQRVVESLADIGSPVLNGAMSTFLAVVVLGGSKSYVFRTLFKQFFLTCLFGVLNGMLTLPVLLTWFGPAPYTNSIVQVPSENGDDKKDVKGSAVIAITEGENL